MVAGINGSGKSLQPKSRKLSDIPPSPQVRGLQGTLSVTGSGEETIEKSNY